MPFHAEFTPIWKDVIEPGVQDARLGLNAVRVDATFVAGSILTKILDGVANSKLILADVSIAKEGQYKGQRNGNVMYELGLSHAIRQSTEIITIRSDTERLDFDVLHINVHQYDRSSLKEARNLVSTLARDAVENTKLEKSLKLQRAIDALDTNSLGYVKEFGAGERFRGPSPKTRGEELTSIVNKAALAKLQELGVVRAHVDSVEAEYEFTHFGRAMARRLGLK